ncbi:hypothetical protein [Streptomyces sp. WAC05858]|uniref:hypothetical protein n=1 Tax=Streptomyces TaxID=1883 RepID=UPI000F7AE3C6|nr:hypothetical protein [Streptomyces sp. WAC05858]RSS33166.1 hypothetical protein EF902_44150 [Streptomyces sp. WAC05858]
MSSNLPAVGSEGAANGYQALQAKLKQLKGAADQLMEEAEQLAQRMRRNSNFAGTVADMTAAAEAEPRHVAAIGDVSEAFGRCVGGGRRVLAAAEGISNAAGQMKTTHQSQYGGIHAAVTSSRARQARPGFYRQT